MIVITGARGFIGSCVANYLYRKGNKNLILVDELNRADKNSNVSDLPEDIFIPREKLVQLLRSGFIIPRSIIHLGARTDTTSTDKGIFDRLNLEYSKALWNIAVKYDIPFIYASSAATYGLGEHGYTVDLSIIDQLSPLNEYARSKQYFDLWALSQNNKPSQWVGLKFFNIYGPNEYHKGRMASVIFHTFDQVSSTGGMKLFKSHREDISNGHQSRDFVYIKDLLDVIFFFINNPQHSGIFNLGTGEARTFLDLAKNTMLNMGIDENISFIDTPMDIRDKYQYFTEADISGLRKAGYRKDFHTLEEGINDYVKNYLSVNKYY